MSSDVTELAREAGTWRVVDLRYPDASTLRAALAPQ